MTVRDIVQAAAGVGGAEGTYIEDVFSTYLYTGTGSALTITNGIDLDGEGGLVWIKRRSGTAASHTLVDSATFTDGSTYLATNLTNGFLNTGAPQFSLLSTGFSLSNNPQWNGTSSDTYASWTFRKAPKFFDVVTYTGTGSARTVSHNLGSVPGCIIVKRTDTTGDWQVYHRANTASPETDYLVLNSNEPTVDSNTRWNDTAPTDSVFTVGTEATVNASGGTYVAYLFAHDAGGFGDDGEQNVISCGSYTGNGGTQDISVGFEPQWLLIKRTNDTSDWSIIDIMRNFAVTTSDSSRLVANDTSAEAGFARIRPTSDGFGFLSDGSPQVNSSGSTYIYIAIRRGPMKTPTSGTEVFTPIAYTGSGGSQVVSTAFPSDTVMHKSRTSSDTYNGDIFVHDRLRGVKVSTQILRTTKTNAESGNTSYWIWEMNNDNLKWATLEDEATGNLSTKTYILYNFRRAPGFFDVVCYTGNDVAGRAIPHNLGVPGEFIIVKARNTTGPDWRTYVSAASDPGGRLNLTNAFYSSAFTGFIRSSDATTFTVGADTDVNASIYNYVAYLFASLAGVSKVGSYTGTGTTLAIDCGFSAGARFVMIKRTDSTGDWYVWDSARGIVSGNDPYLLLNSTAAEVTNTDYVDTSSAGFEITSTAPAAINASGGTFIFLAIA